jgi:hypothetical protein
MLCAFTDFLGVCVVSTVRLAKIPQAMVNTDLTWTGSEVYVWA